ncbi:MAG: hypothetical protein M3170_08805, partial [Candidatus Dormibacteraeota bacterium]|nr:hypothetical protein [Candidatus Dormibacteraeota bacterium]
MGGSLRNGGNIYGWLTKRLSVGRDRLVTAAYERRSLTWQPLTLQRGAASFPIASPAVAAGPQPGRGGRSRNPSQYL